jgi:hypothetical protein
MSSIGGVAYGSSPWTGLQRLQPPSREDLLQSADAQGSGGVDAAALRRMLATRAGGPASVQSSRTAAPAPQEQDDAAPAVRLDGAGLDASLNALAPQAGSTLEFALRRSENPSSARAGGMAGEDTLPAADASQAARAAPQALLQAADANGDQQLDAAEAATPNGALSRVLNPAMTVTTAPARDHAAAPASSSPSSPLPVQRGGPDVQAERLALWMQQQYAAGGGGAFAATGSLVNTSA